MTNYLDKTVAYLRKIEDENKELNALLRVFDKDALSKAKTADEKNKSGQKQGKLAGKSIVIKDNIAIAGKELSCASHILKNYQSVYNATAIERILREDGILIGQSNMDEFAMGSSNENSAWGVVKNCHDLSRVPGGSSGGSAVSVAAEFCDMSLGSETGGSVRQPASFCGVYGLKPSYSAVSRYGLVAFSSSMDQIAPFARNLDDLAILFEVISGHDELDSTSSDNFHFQWTRNNDLAKDFVVGYSDAFFAEGLNPEVRQRIESVIDLCKKEGIRTVKVPLDSIHHSIAVYYILCTAEASANLARFDGLRYGLRCANDGDLHDMYKLSREKGFGEEVKRRILLGTFVLSHGYYDAYYRKAQKVRRLIKNDFNSAFKHCDVIISPTTPTTAFKLNEFNNDPLAMYLADIFTAPANLAGIPAMNIPVGKDSNSLPIGLQVIADSFQEKKCFDFAAFIETYINPKWL